MTESEPKRAYKRDANGKRIGRPRPLPAHVNARNLAIEKQRRQSLNEKFLEIADLIPGFVASPRLNRVLIINRCLDHMRERRRMCVAAAENVEELLAENYKLKSELNTLRMQSMGPSAPQAGAPFIGDALAQLLGVNDEVISIAQGCDETTTTQLPETVGTIDAGTYSGQTAMFGADALLSGTGQLDPFHLSTQGMLESNQTITPLGDSCQLFPQMQNTQIPWAFNPYMESFAEPVL